MTKQSLTFSGLPQCPNKSLQHLYLGHGEERHLIDKAGQLEARHWCYYFHFHTCFKHESRVGFLASLHRS